MSGTRPPGSSLIALILLTLPLSTPSQGEVSHASIDPLAPVGVATGDGSHAYPVRELTPAPDVLFRPPGERPEDGTRVVPDGPGSGGSRTDLHLDALPRTVRAIWVVRDELADPEPERIVTFARELGANTLFVQISGRGDAWYDSDILPRAEQLPETRGDPFARLMTAAKANGISVHAWMNVGLVWSGRKPPVSPKHVLNRHPEWIACMPDGAPLAAVPQDSLLAWYVEGVFAETSHAGYREHVAGVAREILERYPVDGIHLDYIRRPVIDTGYDAPTVGRFLERSGRVAWEIVPTALREQRGAAFVQVGAGAGSAARKQIRDLRHRPSGRAWYEYRDGTPHPARAFRWPDYGDAVNDPAAKEWNDYRRAAVTKAVAGIREVVDEIVAADGRERILTAAVIPDPERAHNRFAQDWARWIEEGLLDYVVPMCYASGRDGAGKQLAQVLAAVPPERVIAGSAAYKQPIPICASTMGDMLDRGVRGVCVFSWASLDDAREDEAALESLMRGWMPQAYSSTAVFVDRMEPAR